MQLLQITFSNRLDECAGEPRRRADRHDRPDVEARHRRPRCTRGVRRRLRATQFRVHDRQGVDVPELRECRRQSVPLERLLCRDDVDRFSVRRTPARVRRRGDCRASRAIHGRGSSDVVPEGPLRPVAHDRRQERDAHALGVGARPCADVEPQVLDRRRDRVLDALSPEVVAAHGEHARDVVGARGIRAIDDGDDHALPFVKLVPQRHVRLGAVHVDAQVAVVGDRADDVPRFVDSARHDASWRALPHALDEIPVSIVRPPWSRGRDPIGRQAFVARCGDERDPRGRGSRVGRHGARVLRAERRERDARHRERGDVSSPARARCSPQDANPHGEGE